MLVMRDLSHAYPFRPVGKTAADQTLERSITTQPLTIQLPPGRFSAVPRWASPSPGWSLKNAVHMRFRIEFSAEAARDFALIFDHLFESYRSFGTRVEAAPDHSEDRIRDIREVADRLGTAPFRGESHKDLLPGLRHLTIDRAVYWFEVNEAEQRVRILAIFFGGQDHVRHMLTRLLTP